MKVFVTGASGFVGGAVLEQLQAAGHFIRILARHPQSARIQAAADRFRAEIHPGDILDSQALEPGLPGVEAVASCFVKAITEPKAIRQTVDLCSEEVLTFDEVLDRILHVTGQKRWKCHIPMALARGLAAGMEQLFAALHKAPPLNRDQLIMLEEKTVGNPQLAKDLFGIKLVPFREGIAQYLPRR